MVVQLPLTEVLIANQLAIFALGIHVILIYDILGLKGKWWRVLEVLFKWIIYVC